MKALKVQRFRHSHGLESWLDEFTRQHELTAHWKGCKTRVQKSSFAGEKALAGLHRDRGFSRWQQVLLQTQLAVFAGGKPALVTALMTPTDPVGKSELPGTPSVFCVAHTQVLLNINSAVRIFFFSVQSLLPPFPPLCHHNLSISAFLYKVINTLFCSVLSCQMNTTNQNTTTLN